MTQLIQQADQQLQEVEGYALEDLVAQLYEEHSRLGIGDFSLTNRVAGYWDRSDVEIDLVAMDETSHRLRFATCKRNAQRLVGSVGALKQAASRFIVANRAFTGWDVEYVAIAPTIPSDAAKALYQENVRPQSLEELIAVYYT